MRRTRRRARRQCGAQGVPACLAGNRLGLAETLGRVCRRTGKPPSADFGLLGPEGKRSRCRAQFAGSRVALAVTVDGAVHRFGTQRHPAHAPEERAEEDEQMPEQRDHGRRLYHAGACPYSVRAEKGRFLL